MAIETRVPLTRRAFFALTAGVVGWSLGAAGCGDLGTMAYFLSPEQRIEPKIKHLAVAKDDKKKKEPVVVIWTCMPVLETRTEFIQADRQLGELLGQQLKELAKQSEEKLKVVSGRKVEEFKSANPDWKQMTPTELGRRFDADHVIYLEIHSLSLYEPGSFNQLMRGRANINVQLVDVQQPDELAKSETYTCIWPGDAPGPVQVGTDMQPYQFREKFLGYVSRELSHYFSKYPRDHRYRME